MSKTDENKMPAVSVVVPVYNVEAWLGECLDSIIAQSIRDIEIICVDDGSTDNSPEILKEYAKRDERIRVVFQENKGASEARNRGAREAKGTYLYFMDSDDIIEPEALELCVTDMEKRRLEYVCFNAVAFADSPDKAEMAEKMNANYYNRTLDESRVFDGKELFRELSDKSSVVITVWSCVILRSAFIDNALWFSPDVIYEDEFWMFSALMSLKRCGCINRALYKNRIRQNSITQSEYTFLNSYGAFSAANDIRNYIVKHPDCINEADNGSYEYKRVVMLQQIAVNRYRAISEKEREKRFELEPEERALFEQTVAYPAYIQQLSSRFYAERNELAKQKAALQNEKEELILKNKKLRKQKKKLKRRIETIRKSGAYRIGSVIMWLPEKIKALFAALKSR